MRNVFSGLVAAVAVMAAAPAMAGKTLDAAKVNLEWVLGNKLLVASVNGNRRHFELGLQALAHGEMAYPGVTQRILTHPVAGLDGYEEMMRLLEEKEALKVFVDVAG